MSQQELAEKIGYKDKSAISKVERGDRDINQSLIIKYAEALRTTPAYLMGWEEEKSNTLTEADLSEGEMMLIELYRSMPKETQEIALKMLEAVVQGQKK
jgi:transcriptional regulator with XRE-family HTH domain